jgi:hypothetical protein
MSSNKPYFSVGEVCILQPPHPSARHLWGQETTVLHIFQSEGTDDAMGQKGAHWCYETDIPAPPPTDLPEDQHDGWVWCEYDLKKKYDSGQSFEQLLEELNDLILIDD